MTRSERSTWMARSAYLAALILLAGVDGLRAFDDYLPGPDSQVQPGVPKGQLFSFVFSQSKIYPGTVRTCWVYIPAQYRPEQPACLYVCQDAVAWRAPVVFDNLIARQEMPVTIGVFVSPGIVGPKPASGLALGQYNRVYEYSGMDDTYARFLLEELLPEVASRKTPDGRPIRISPAANDHAIAGSSAGGICAFNAAWERPDAFARVFSSVGSFNLGGGEVFPILIRKFEPKPLRIFLQDGSRDTGVFAGSWWMANQAVEESLRFSGYEVNHAWGDGGHTTKQATAVFPDAMRWLWKDWPQPVKTGETRNALLALALRPGEGWQRLAGDYGSLRGAASNRRGEVFFGDAGENRIYRAAPDGSVAVFATDTGPVSDLCFGSDGRLYTVSTESGQVRAYAADGSSTLMAAGIPGNGIAIAHNGNVYVTHPGNGAGGMRSDLWLIKPDGTRRVLDCDGPIDTGGIVLSPAQNLLFVADRREPWIYRYLVQPDGSLRYGQRYLHLHRSGGDEPVSQTGMRADRDGRLYVATRLGIQIGGEASLVNAIITTPNRKVTDVCFGGAGFDTLFALCGDTVFQRRLNLRGANGWDAPNEPGALKASPIPK